MNILVVSPHPDDETLGAGGTLLKLKKQGHKVFWLNVTDMKLEDGWSLEKIEHRQRQISEISSFFGFETVYNLKLSPARLASYDEEIIISEIRKVFDEVSPEWIFIPGRYDAHSDHKVVYDCCMACSKSFRAPYIKRIMTMEILSETDHGYQKEKYEPNLFVDISNEYDDKVRALQIYDSEMGDHPFPRSIENVRALATLRGAESSCRFAESFCLVRQFE